MFRLDTAKPTVLRLVMEMKGSMFGLLTVEPTIVFKLQISGKEVEVSIDKLETSAMTKVREVGGGARATESKTT